MNLDLKKIKNSIANRKRVRAFKKARKENSPYFYYWDKVSDIDDMERHGANYVFGWFLGTALIGMGGVTASIILNAQIDEAFGEGMFKNFVLASSAVMFSGFPLGILAKHNIYSKYEKYKDLYNKKSKEDATKLEENVR